MIVFNVIDNSGGKKARLIKVLNKRAGEIGDIIVVAIIEGYPNKKVKKGEVHKGIIIRTRKGIRRPDGTEVKFNENGIVLLGEDLSPIGTRIFGPIPMELNKNKKIITLATKII